MQIQAYVPSAKFIVGVVIVLAVLGLISRSAGSNPTVAKVLHYMGYTA